MLQENILKEAPPLNTNSHRLLNISQRILHSKRRILPSPMPKKRPVNSSAKLLGIQEHYKILNMAVYISNGKGAGLRFQAATECMLLVGKELNSYKVLLVLFPLCFLQM